MATFDLFRELDRLTSPLLDYQRSPRLMPVDVYRDGNLYVLNADLPGVDPGSVDIEVDGQLLTIRAERTMGSGEDVKWLIRERTGGSFVRQFSLGRGLDVDGITASYENGVLSVTVPVTERELPRKVEIQSGTPKDTIQIESGEKREHKRKLLKS